MKTNKILELRIKANLSQKDLAVKLGVTQASIQNWEVGRVHPQPLHLYRIEKLLLANNMPGVGAGEFTDDHMSPEDIRGIRLILNKKVSEFAKIMDVHELTVRSWELGRQRPRGNNKLKLQQLMAKRAKTTDIVEDDDLANKIATSLFEKFKQSVTFS